VKTAFNNKKTCKLLH